MTELQSFSEGERNPNIVAVCFKNVEVLISGRKSENSTTPAQYPVQVENECDICMRITTRRCSNCNKGFFCSDSCQEKRSGSHLFKCSKRPLTSANYL